MEIQRCIEMQKYREHKWYKNFGQGQIPDLLDASNMYQFLLTVLETGQ